MTVRRSFSSLSALATLILSITLAATMLAQTPGTWAKSGTLLSAGLEAYTLNDGRVFVPGSDLIGTVGPQVWTPATGQWALLPQHIYGRVSSATIVLNDGRVLVTGGQSSMYTAEIFDPATNQWRLTAGSLTQGRYAHRMTKLADGRILLSGGCVASGCAQAAATAEVFDPATESFTATGAMSQVRTQHVAVLLKSGKVLIAGGYTTTGTGVSRVAEVWDPKTGIFTKAGQMTATRGEHTGTRLVDGRVLVTGGLSDYGAIIGSAELYDPATGKWTATKGAMPYRRYEHSAILLPSGKVLVCGGFSIIRDASVALTAGETFDPATGLFTATGAMTQPRVQFGLTKLKDGRIFAVGGDYAVIGPHLVFYGDSEIYKP